MTPKGLSYFHLMGLLTVFTSLVPHSSYCGITVTVESVDAYSALLRWRLAISENTSVIGFTVTIQVGSTSREVETVNNGSATSYELFNLDDMRDYNACVTTKVESGASETGCATFETPPGNSTYIAIACAIFLLLCFIIFGVLDFVSSNKHKEQMTRKEEELLEQGWQTFQRNSKKKQKGKKRAAPKRPRPDSSVDSDPVASAETPSGDVRTSPPI
ncbi:uncharacterized protein LOC110978971 [Acanthaster planci]|uniref:Uncharacterized protein LOC110978971 n=1 Tax=Acanthaster planci TaxID=133434 RepID=A0A8B7Y9Y9_ACAPL|nr:uncharacterized protein LOC110978971 [Acanthaster planci]XP_022090059.1 uncharacterized protein LOC110978971 [Acanthaster planci]